MLLVSRASISNSLTNREQNISCYQPYYINNTSCFSNSTLRGLFYTRCNVRTQLPNTIARELAQKSQNCASSRTLYLILFIMDAIAPFCAKKKKWTVSKQIRTSKLTMYACMQLSWHQCHLKIVLLWLYMLWSRPCTRTAPEFWSGLDTKNRSVHTQISPCTLREHRTRVLCLDPKYEHSQRFNLFLVKFSGGSRGEARSPPHF